jgi:hypothetical protein
MSTTLSWRPIHDGKSLPDHLKFKLRSRYNLDTWREFSNSDREYLQGLVDCDVEGAKELMELIERYGSVELKLEY